MSGQDKMRALDPFEGERKLAAVRQSRVCESKRANLRACQADMTIDGQAMAGHVAVDGKPVGGKCCSVRVGKVGVIEEELAADVCADEADFAYGGESPYCRTCRR